MPSESSWQRARLGDLVQTQKGFAFKSSWYSDYGHPVVKVSDFTADSIDASSLTRVPDEIAEKYRRYELLAGDLVIQTVGSWPNNPASVVGKCIRVPIASHKALLNQNAVRLDPTNLVSKSFLYYCLRSPHFSSYIVGTAQGAASQAAITLDSIRQYEISLPPLPTQRKIAAILSAYDDLIENNLRRIQILEEMAQNLYREWFVHFRYPGHADVPLVDSPLGPIPQGWAVKKLIDVCDLTMGQSPKSEFYNTDKIGLPFHQGVSDFGDRFPTERQYCNVEGRIAEQGDILFSVRAPVGRINIASTKMVIGRGLCAIRHKLGYQWFAFHHLKESFKEEDTMGSGTIFKAVTKNDVEGIAFIQTPTKLERQFEATVTPLNMQVENLTQKNVVLRRTRDLLLPKLISGELDVSQLDIALSAEVAE